MAVCELYVFIDYFQEEEEAPPTFEAGKMLELSSKNFQKETANGNIFIMWYTNWCPHSTNLMPTWEVLAVSAKEKDVKIARVSKSLSLLEAQFKNNGLNNTLLANIIVLSFKLFKAHL